MTRKTKEQWETELRFERNRADRALAAAAEIGNALDTIEQRINGAGRYGSVFEVETDIREQIRVGRENAKQCYRGDIPQLVTAFAEIRRLNDELAAFRRAS